jgi:ribonuclease BN (tRNA processing enzyme)
MKPHRVTCLGTADAYSAQGRHLAAYLLHHDKGALLLDCGPTILASLNRHAVSADPVDAVLISHFHGDHFAGLPFLFLHLMYMEPRSRPLRIVGPPGVERRIMDIFRATYAEAAAEPLPYALEFVEIAPKETVVLNGAEVEAFLVPHQENPPSMGFEIRTGEKKITYSGDSGWTEELIAHTQGADLFLCECTFFETRYDKHLDYPRIVENLDRFGAKRLVLTHLGQEVLNRREEVVLEMAYDGMIIEL